MSDEGPAKRETDTVSSARIIEGVSTNVITALVLAVLGGILALLGLLVQRLTNYVVVPTNVLAAVAFIGLGLLLAGVILGLATWVIWRQNPWIGIGLALGWLIGTSAGRSVLKQAFDAFAKEQSKKFEETLDEKKRQQP